MKTPTVILWGLSLWGLAPASTSLGLQLQQDYTRLVNGCPPIRTYQMDPSTFQTLFWEGSKEAIHYYHEAQRHPTFRRKDLIHPFEMKHPSVHPVSRLPRGQLTLEKGIAALSRFNGNWFGLWKDQKVRHLWLPVRESKQRINLDHELLAFQSAFTGDGIGWNYLVQYCDEVLLLGFVYHYREDGSMQAQTPHYAFLDEQGQITWVTKDHIYFETVCHHDHGHAAKHYVITGKAFAKTGRKPALIHQFQAVYLAKRQHLPKFRYIPQQVQQVRSAKKILSLLLGLWEALSR